MDRAAEPASPISDAARVEEAGLNALQTQRQLFYDGWLLRVSPGAAKRARSVNAHFGSSLPVGAKIAYCERVYREQGLPTLFRMTPFVHPAGLDDVLARGGFVAFGDTLVQTLALERPVDAPEARDGVAVEAPDLPDFVDAVGELRGSSALHREVHRERLTHSVLGKRYAVVRAEGRVVCAAQVAVEGRIVGIFDVVTDPAQRRKGYATLACASLLSWAWQHGAQLAYLQVSADNAPAIAVYRRFGFATAYTYHYRGRPGACE